MSSREYYETHREQIREYNRWYRGTHREQNRERCRKYDETHRKQKREYNWTHWEQKRKYDSDRRMAARLVRKTLGINDLPDTLAYQAMKRFFGLKKYKRWVITVESLNQLVEDIRQEKLRALMPSRKTRTKDKTVEKAKNPGEELATR